MDLNIPTSLDIPDIEIDCIWPFNMDQFPIFTIFESGKLKVYIRDYMGRCWTIFEEKTELMTKTIRKTGLGELFGGDSVSYNI